MNCTLFCVDSLYVNGKKNKQKAQQQKIWLDNIRDDCVILGLSLSDARKSVVHNMGDQDINEEEI